MPFADSTAPTSTPSTLAPEPPATSDAASPATVGIGDAEVTDESMDPAGSDVLMRGDRGDDVAELQQALVRHGFEIEVDGLFGPATDVAVRGFQYSHGLEADGIAGPEAWTTLTDAEENSTVILRDDGLTIADFGDSAALVMPALLNVFGSPAWDFTAATTFPCEQDPCEGLERTVRWSNPEDASFSVRFQETNGELLLAGWELSGFGDRRGVSLATSKGVALDSTASALSSAHPNADFGYFPEPACGDAWWDPGAFRIDTDDDDLGTGLRGSLDHDWDVMLQALDAALIAHGIPEGLDCYQDVMCAEVFGRFQQSVGLTGGSGLDRSTWLALGLPLPPDMDARIQSLRAGQTVTEC